MTQLCMTGAKLCRFFSAEKTISLVTVH